MAAPLSNTFEGGTDTTTITTGNSGGASGDAFNTVTIGASATLTFSATHAAHGGLGMQIVQPVTAVSTFVDWTAVGGGTADTFFRIYVYRTANGSAKGYIMAARTTTGTATAYLAIGTTGLVECQNPAGGVLALGSVPIGLNQWVRIEWRVKSSTTVGEVEWRLYNTADSTTITETQSATGAVLGATTDQIRWGTPSTPQPASDTSWYDDLAVSTAGWIGPAGQAGPPSVNPDYTTFPKFLVKPGRVGGL
jgi:hypothetical protein